MKGVFSKDVSSLLLMKSAIRVISSASVDAHCIKNVGYSFLKKLVKFRPMDIKIPNKVNVSKIHKKARDVLNSKEE